MNKEQLRQFIEGLSDDTEIIIVRTPQEALVVPKRCERVDVNGKAVLVLRKLKEGLWVVAVAWILQSVELLPKPHAVLLAAKDQIALIVKTTDWNFPYTEHDNRFPMVAFHLGGTIHYIPPSGIPPNTLAQTGSFYGNSVV